LLTHSEVFYFALVILKSTRIGAIGNHQNLRTKERLGNCFN